MASRFFHGDSSSDSDYSSSDTESISSSISSGEESDESQEQQAPSAYAKSGTGSAFSRFLRDEDDDSDDESSTRRVVKSAKDKFYDELRDCIHGIENGKKINDWIAIQTRIFARFNLSIY